MSNSNHGAPIGGEWRVEGLQKQTGMKKEQREKKRKEARKNRNGRRRMEKGHRARRYKYDKKLIIAWDVSSDKKVRKYPFL